MVVFYQFWEMMRWRWDLRWLLNVQSPDCHWRLWHLSHVSLWQVDPDILAKCLGKKGKTALKSKENRKQHVRFSVSDLKTQRFAIIMLWLRQSSSQPSQFRLEKLLEGLLWSLGGFERKFPEGGPRLLRSCLGVEISTRNPSEANF